MDKQTYITREGYERLVAELNELRSTKRKEIAQRIQEAKELGDLSENAEYSEAKNEQAFAEGRILELSSMLKEAKVVENDAASGASEVQIGTTVTLKGPRGTQTVALVGANEADPTAGRISNESPIGAALLGHRAGERVTVNVPAGPVEYEVLALK